jgi:hypothetical protein
MKTTMRFKEFKEEILRRAKAANACPDEYKRALQSESFAELMQVGKDNFGFACAKKVIDSSLIEAYREEFNANEIYCNVSVDKGYLLVCDDATVKASGSAIVEASGSAIVEASDSAIVKAWGSATVKALDNATVKASGSAIVKAWGNATVKAWGNATVKALDNATVKALDNATVKASGKSYVTSYSTIECRLSDNAIHRIRESNTIRYASDEIKFEKVTASKPEATKTDNA